MSIYKIDLPGVGAEAAAAPSHQDIAERAYQRHRQHGEWHGRDLDDWLEAERELLDERAKAALATLTRTSDEI